MDFVTLCFSEANFLPTMMLIVVVLYWMLMIFGVVGMDMFDIDVDVDTDLGMDLDAGIDGSFETGDGHHGEASTVAGSTTTGSQSFLKEAFDFFYLSDVPIVIVGSAFAFSFWVSSLISNGMFNPALSFNVSLIWLIPNLVIALVSMRIMMMPMARILRKSAPEDFTRSKMIGVVGRVVSRQVTDKFGEIEVREPDGTEVILNACVAKGKKSLSKGDAAKIVSYNHDQGTFLVELTKWESNLDD